MIISIELCYHIVNLSYTKKFFFSFGFILVPRSRQLCIENYFVVVYNTTDLYDNVDINIFQGLFKLEPKEYVEIT